jgi:hypothetical protein
MDTKGFGRKWPGPKRGTKLFLCLNNEAVCHEGILGSGGIAPPVLTSALDGGEWSASQPGRFTPGKIAPGTHCRGEWVGFRAGLDAVEKRTKLPFQESKAGRPAHRHADLAIPTSLIEVLFGILLAWSNWGKWRKSLSRDNKYSGWDSNRGIC